MGIDKIRKTSAAAELRRHAEELIKGAKPFNMQPGRIKSESLRLVHELQVHQVELEMQNEELRQSRNEVESALHRYTDLYDFAPVGYLTLDRKGTIQAANLTGASLLGVDRANLTGQRFKQFITKDSQLFFSEFFAKVFSNQKKNTCELALKIKDKPKLFVHIEAVALAADKECRVVFTDITDRKQAAEEIERLNTALAARAKELEDANIELEAFNYSVSHDLRRPLTAISSYCQAIHEICSNSLDEQCKRYFQEIYQGTLRMNQLINTLLNFSSITHAEISHEMVDLSKMAEAVATELKLAVPNCRVKFLIAEGITCKGDVDLMRVVLGNLMGNAWKYTCNRENSVIELGMTEIDGTTAFFVRDNGLGFNMAHVAKLFIPFQCLPGTEDLRGHGIGLAMVERIIKRHGGKVWAEGEVGKGAAFYFTLQD